MLNARSQRKAHRVWIFLQRSAYIPFTTSHALSILSVFYNAQNSFNSQNNIIRIPHWSRTAGDWWSQDSNPGSLVAESMPFPGTRHLLPYLPRIFPSGRSAQFLSQYYHLRAEDVQIFIRLTACWTQAGYAVSVKLTHPLLPRKLPGPRVALSLALALPSSFPRVVNQAVMIFLSSKFQEHLRLHQQSLNTDSQLSSQRYTEK